MIRMVCFRGCLNCRKLNGQNGLSAVRHFGCSFPPRSRPLVLSLPWLEWRCFALQRQEEVADDACEQKEEMRPRNLSCHLSSPKYPI